MFTRVLDLQSSFCPWKQQQFFLSWKCSGLSPQICHPSEAPSKQAPTAAATHISIHLPFKCSKTIGFFWIRIRVPSRWENVEPCKEKTEEKKSDAAVLYCRDGETLLTTTSWNQKMLTLWGDQDSTMERGANGAKNALQCLWGSLQVWPSLPRVPTCCKSNVCSVIALQLPQEGHRDEKEGC